MRVDGSVIEEINKVNALTDRVQKRKKEYEDAPSYLTSQRSHSFTESWKETEGQPFHLRRAKAYARVMDDSPAVIRDGELIVGSIAEHIRGADTVPEWDPQAILKNLEEEAAISLTEAKHVMLDAEDRRLLKEDALYWVGKSGKEAIAKAWQEYLGEKHFDVIDATDEGAMAVETSLVAQNGEAGGPSGRLFKEGLNDIIARIRTELDNMTNSSSNSPEVSPAGYHKLNVLKGMIVACEAVIRFAQRHAVVARKMASTERDPVRKKELEQIAEHCDWVPAKAPRTFAEGLQSLWFYHLAFCKENPMVPIYLGLMDHWLYPLYEKDLKEGRLTRQAAAELLGCLFVKINEGESFRGFIIAQTAAASMFRHITIGGKTKDGKDITNELSFLILEVTRQMKMRDPAVYIRYHDGINQDFMIKALEVVRDYKGGNPAFLNYEVAARNLMDYGASMEDAAEWVGSGCLNYHIPHCNIHPQALDVLNLSKILEITLHDGVDPRTGKKIGLETGDVTKFTRIEQLYEAWEKQVAWFFDISVRSCFIGHSVRILECNSNPFGSALLEDCITKGLDLNEGGVRYPGQQVNIGDRGCTDVADSLAAIKYLVYDNKKLTMAELLDVLAADFEGQEDVRQMCLQAPKYGNDDDYADDIFNYVSLKVQEIMLNKPNPWTGKKWRLFRPASTGHYYQGRVVGALPNGRKAWTALNDAAFSAMGGADTKGPTALINSATEVDHFRHLNAGILNMKFSKAIVTTSEKLAKVLALVKTFMDRDQFHIQFNITSQQDLIEARKHPEQWKSLIVRVAGYSAYFVELPTEIQDEIIARTEHEV